MGVDVGEDAVEEEVVGLMTTEGAGAMVGGVREEEG